MPTGEPSVYTLHGVLLRSTVPLAGFLTDGDESDVDVQWAAGGPVPDAAPEGRVVAAAARPGLATDSYLYVATAGEAGGWTLRVPGVCDFVVDGTRRAVECRPDPSADPAFVAVLVSGLVVAFLLALDGHCTLHASAVDLDGTAVAFAGPSGAGKSTLAALLCAAGGRLVTDDVLRLGLTPPIGCVGGSPHLRLRPGAAWALDTFPTPPATGVTVDRRLAVTPPPAGDRPATVPLAAVVLPRLSRQAAALDLRPATGAAAVARLAAVCRVAGWTDPDVVRAQFRALAQVAAGVPVLEAVVPWGPAPRRSPVVPALLDLAARR